MVLNTTDSVFIENAGLVLLQPFLPQLFQLRGLIHNNQFKDAKSQYKAIQLLEYAATGSTSASEPLLVLNKLCCGLGPVDPIEMGMPLDSEDRNEVMAMLKAVITRWGKLDSTSVPGFQQSFLQRSGQLQFSEGLWQLTVEERSFDILLDMIPWAYTLIKFPWMPHPLSVSWRNE